jgi:tRNA (cmo5U34)-methyltransferase
LKERNGYSREEIARKALALEGVQVPLAASWNEAMLRRARFTEVDCFWRCWNFAGWIAVKAA